MSRNDDTKKKTLRDSPASPERPPFIPDEDEVDPERWAELEEFLNEKVPLWADGEKVQIADRSKGHNLVYSLATGNGGHNSAHHLYELFLRTVAEVSNGRRRATERERHEKVVKPLAGSVFKYLDQLHVDKGGLPDLKTAAMMLWNDPQWRAADWLPEPKRMSSHIPAGIHHACDGMVSSKMPSNPHGWAGGAAVRQRALKVLKERERVKKDGQTKQTETEAASEDCDDTKAGKATMEEVLEEEFGSLSFEDMLAGMKEEGLSSFGTGTGSVVLEDGIFGHTITEPHGVEHPAHSPGHNPAHEGGGEAEAEVNGVANGEATKKKPRSRGGAKRKKKR